MNTAQPEFRPIPGHPGYQSDRQGNVRRQSRDGHFPQRIPGGWKYLTGTVQKRGCRVYCLPTNGTRTTFYFDDEDGRATRASLDYINNQPVPVRSFVSSYKEMRSVMYASRKETK